MPEELGSLGVKDPQQAGREVHLLQGGQRILSLGRDGGLLPPHIDEDGKEVLHDPLSILHHPLGGGHSLGLYLQFIALEGIETHQQFLGDEQYLAVAIVHVPIGAIDKALVKEFLQGVIRLEPRSFPFHAQRTKATDIAIARGEAATGRGAAVTQQMDQGFVGL